MAFPKKISDHVPVLKDQGIDYVVGSSAAGKSIQAFSITSGGTPDAITFAGQGLTDMADANYQVLVNGETTGAVSVDESTKTTAGFSILGGGSAEVLHVIVIGRLAGQAA